jgi:hypothetical protein
MDSARNVSATFSLIDRALSTTTDGHGTIARSPEQPSYPHGSRVRLTASARHAATASSAGAATRAARSIRWCMPMGTDHTVSASFALNAYSLGIATVGSGAVAARAGAGELRPRRGGAAHRHRRHRTPLRPLDRDLAGSSNPATLVMDEPEERDGRCSRSTPTR